VTGAGGYVGASLCAFLRRQGRRVLELHHREPGDEARGAFAHRFRLEDGLGPDVLRGVELLIHCAYDFRPTRWPDIVAVNLEGSKRLFDSAVAAGVPNVVFISTMSSFPGCRSHYGRVKLAMEDEARERNFIVIRPGLVFGPQPGGMLGGLRRAVAKSSFLPIVGGRKNQYLIHEEDLARLILAAAERGTDRLRQPVTAAAERPLTLRQILQILARARSRRVTLLPVPWRAAWLALRSAELVGLHPSFRSDSVISLMHPDPDPVFTMTRALGVSLREFTAEAIC
jgi:nucleoside-diphosphate-sugar epimerase